jgi:putative MFS transporter
MNTESLVLRNYRPALFWLGTLMIIGGVIAHMPMFLMSAPMGYQMAGMPMDNLMLAGMAAIVSGLIVAAFALVPPRSDRAGGHDAAHLHVIDDAPLTRQHWKVIGALCVAIVIDVMKPATLGFVVPGMSAEYGLGRLAVSLFPLSALTGTTVGSIVWGIAADRLGRRAVILLAALMFIGTAICGAMPSFAWNVFMCFLMGLAAGGLLPITFTLMAEMVPARHRGWLLVLLGGIGVTGGYFVASANAAMLEPLFGWRVLWFMGLPTGLTLVILNRYIPESPRFLFLQGRSDEARRLLERFSIVLEPNAPVPPQQAHASISIFRLFMHPYAGLTIGLTLCGTAWGLVNFGFLLWLPSDLRSMGLSPDISNHILARGALFSTPGILLVTWLYHAWSSRYTLITFAFATSVALAGFIAFGALVVDHPALLTFLLGALLFASAGTISVLIPYATEIYPLSVRATGSGLVAASSKLGGIIGAWLPAIIKGIVATAATAAIPIAAAAAILVFKAIETRGARLEDIAKLRLRVRAVHIE